MHCCLYGEQWKRLDVFDLLWMLNFDTGVLLRKKPAHLTTSTAYLYVDHFQPRLALVFPGGSRCWSNVLIGPHRLTNLQNQRHEAGADLLAQQILKLPLSYDIGMYIVPCNGNNSDARLLLQDSPTTNGSARSDCGSLLAKSHVPSSTSYYVMVAIRPLHAAAPVISVRQC